MEKALRVAELDRISRFDDPCISGIPEMHTM